MCDAIMLNAEVPFLLLVVGVCEEEEEREREGCGGNCEGSADAVLELSEVDGIGRGSKAPPTANATMQLPLRPTKYLLPGFNLSCQS
jgi:hypothetical protein